MADLHLSTYDYIVLTVLLLLNLIFWKVRIKGRIGCLIPVILFGIILPGISMSIEVNHFMDGKDANNVEDFELLYIYSRFPLYWSVGALQILLLFSRKTQNIK